MNGNSMTIERFRDLVASYGARPLAWPEEERGAALAFLASNSQAARLVDEEEMLDRFLALAPEIEPADEAFVERLLDVPATAGSLREDGPAAQSNIADRAVSALTGWLGTRPIGAEIAGLAAAGALGLLLGFSNLLQQGGTEEIDVSAYMFGDPSLRADMEIMD